MGHNSSKNTRPKNDQNQTLCSIMSSSDVEISICDFHRVVLENKNAQVEVVRLSILNTL